jgi:hypothetical protein
MTSFRLAYDAAEDVLVASFGEESDAESRHVPLNDHIDLWADVERTTVHALAFRAYSRLLGVSETYFSALREADDETVSATLRLVAEPPASRFFDLTDPEGLIARVLSPRIEELFQSDEV